MPADFHIQPVTVVYTAPEGEDDRFYGFWGDMAFGGHFAKVAAARRQGKVNVIFHDPIPVGEQSDRKSLALSAGQIVNQTMESTRASALA